LALTSDIQNANASHEGKEVGGNFEYSFKVGDQLRSGNQVLQATFIPNSEQYETAVISRLISVLPSLRLIVLEDPFGFEFNSVTGNTYHIEVSDDLSKWITVEKIVAEGSKTLHKPTLKPIERVKFFRVRKE